MVSAKPLSSITKIAGSLKTDAKFNDSRNCPVLEPPVADKADGYPAVLSLAPRAPLRNQGMPPADDSIRAHEAERRIRQCIEPPFALQIHPLDRRSRASEP